MNVLLLASEPLPRGELTAWLNAGGHDVREVEPLPFDPWEADVIVLWMPRLLDPVLQRIRLLRSQPFSDRVRILALGSWRDPSEIRQVLDAGVDDYLKWPTDEEAFRLRLLVIEMDRARRPLSEHHLRLQARLADTQKAESLAALAGTVAHDFNNLLSAILGNAELAMLDLSPDSETRYSLEQIEKASRRAAELTRQMLTYSGRGPHTHVPLNLTQLVEEMADLLRISMSKKCGIEYEFGRGLPAVKGDPAQLRQVVMNLLINASEACAASHAMVRLATRQIQVADGEVTGIGQDNPLRAGAYVALEVSDEGVGMDAYTKAHIFDPFFTTKKSGRGLGLAAVLGIINAHGGALRLESEPGRGSRFEVLLPALEFDAAREETSGESIESWRGTGTVLLVDDEEAVREAGRRLLEKAGYTVLAACNGEQGLEVFADFADEISAVILDLSMPGMDGMEVFRTIRQSKPDMQVIVWSGFEEREVTAQLEQIGQCRFIEKPSHVRELGLALRDALQASN